MRRILKIILAAALVIGTLLPTNVFANEKTYTGKQIKEITVKASHYFVLDKSRVYFDSGKAVEQGESEEVVQQGLLVETISNLYNEGKLQQQLRSWSFPVWGNYCGPGHSGNNFTEPALDILDEGCRQHDMCYKGMGFQQNCECNKALIQYIDDHYDEMEGFRMKAVAQAIRAYFASFGSIGC